MYKIIFRLDRLEGVLNDEGSKSISLVNDSELNGAGSELVDRLATEVNHLNFLVAKCQGAALLDSFEPVRIIINFFLFEKYLLKLLGW